MAAKIKKPKKMRISVALSADDLASLEAIASEQERSVSWMASRAIHTYLTERIEIPAASVEASTQHKDA